MPRLYSLDQSLAAAPEGPVPEQYRTADRPGGIRIGTEHLFFRRLTRVFYVPLSQIVWAYKRREDSSATLCCGRTTFASFFLVVHTAGGASARIPMDSERLVDLALERLAASCSGIRVGYPGRDGKER